MLKGVSEDNIVEYLHPQGDTTCKRFKIKKDGNLVETNALLLTFESKCSKIVKKFSIVWFQLMYIYQILCAVLTTRGSDIMKTTVLKTPDMYVRTVERMVMPITLVNVKILPNA